jgi:hypothetical protein
LDYAYTTQACIDEVGLRQPDLLTVVTKEKAILADGHVYCCPGLGAVG